jgi:hypothetical protein
MTYGNAYANADKYVIFQKVARPIFARVAGRPLSSWDFLAFRYTKSTTTYSGYLSETDTQFLEIAFIQLIML